MNKYIVGLLILITSITSLYSEEVDSSDSFYIKGGVALPPCEKLYTPIPVAAIGFGWRHQEGNHGHDLSLNLSSLVVINYLSVKGLFLYYPFPENNYRLYFGAGPGLGYQMSIGNEGGCVSFEGIIGFEFRCYSHFKPFVQLELTQPVVRFSSKGPGQHQPGAAIILGIGF